MVSQNLILYLLCLLHLVQNRSVDIKHEHEGFYRTKYARLTGKRSVCLALLVDAEKAKPIFDSRSWRMYNIPFQTHRPHLGTQVRPEKFEEVIGKGVKIDAVEAEKLWKYHADFSKRQCSHMFWTGRCQDSIMGVECDVSCNFPNEHFLFVLFLVNFS